jgi:hypothetical protein
MLHRRPRRPNLNPNRKVDMLRRLKVVTRHPKAATRRRPAGSLKVVMRHPKVATRLRLEGSLKVVTRHPKAPTLHLRREHNPEV